MAFICISLILSEFKIFFFSKLRFINKTSKNWFVNLHIELQMKLKDKAYF
jgi:hypothetical protein